MRYGKARSRLALALLALAIACCTLLPGSFHEAEASTDAPTTGAEVRRHYPRELKAFKEWLRLNIVPGRTTREDILELFGPGAIPVDRPPRDGLITFEYSLETLGIRAPGAFLCIDFDSRTCRRAYIGVSWAICGFCPHVFAQAGLWRLEGKVLAGCVGEGREGTDTLLLPRLTPKNDMLRVRLSNMAPEVEFIDQARLGWVALEAGEELDVDTGGHPFVWKPARQLNVRLDDRTPARELFTVDVTGQQVLVLEVRNTPEFETAMRDHLLHGRPAPSAALTLHCDDGSARVVHPVGTKFLRRVVVPLLPGGRSARIYAPNPFWLVRRLWVGTGRAVEEATVWQAPVKAEAPQAGAVSLLQDRDGLHLRLQRGEDADLTFFAPTPAAAHRRWGYLLRTTGYYDFLPR